MSVENKMINFNDLPCDILNLIYKKNRSWTNEQIQNNKNNFNDCIESINNFGYNITWEEHREPKEILEIIKDAKQSSINPFCMACECCDGCDDEDCYFKKDDVLMATANFILCNTCNCPYGANNNNMAGLDNLCYDCENMTDEDDY